MWEVGAEIGLWNSLSLQAPPPMVTYWHVLVMTGVQERHSCSRGKDEESDEEQVETEGEQADDEESDEEKHPGTM